MGCETLFLRIEKDAREITNSFWICSPLEWALDLKSFSAGLIADFFGRVAHLHDFR